MSGKLPSEKILPQLTVTFSVHSFMYHFCTVASYHVLRPEDAINNLSASCPVWWFALQQLGHFAGLQCQLSREGCTNKKNIPPESITHNNATCLFSVLTDTIVYIENPATLDFGEYFLWYFRVWNSPNREHNTLLAWVTSGTLALKLHCNDKACSLCLTPYYTRHGVSVYYHG